MVKPLKVEAVIGLVFVWVSAVFGHPGSLDFLDNSLIENAVPQETHSMALRLQGPRGVSTNEFLSSSKRPKRNQEGHHIISDCIYMTSEEGEYFFKAKEEGLEACGIYISSEADQLIEIQFSYVEVPCENGGLVVVVDGWELNGQLFPSPEDHPRSMKSRFFESCGRRKIKQVFVSSQNVALIQYRVPLSGSSFGFTIRFVKNPYPCNALFQLENTFTIRNFGRRSNCSLTSIFPGSIKILALDVGVTPTIDRALQIETGTIHKCNKRGLDDYLQIGGSLGLDNFNMEVADSVCGLTSKPTRRTELVACEITTARLVSSGAFENAVTVSMKRLTDEELMNGHMSVFCVPEGLQ